MNWVILILAALFNAAANVFIKAGMQRLAANNGGNTLQAYAFEPRLWVGVTCFGIALIGYAKTLQHFDVSMAYPIMTGLGFAIVATCGALYFGEQLGTLRLTGMAIIIFGIILLARS